MIFFLSFIIYFQYGYLTVLSEESDLSVYLDGKYFGKTPIIRERLKPGKYTISLFSEEDMELAYQKVKRGAIFQKLSGLWELAKYAGGSERIRIAPDTITEIFLSKRDAENFKKKAKISFFSFLMVPFILGLITGIIAE